MDFGIVLSAKRKGDESLFLIYEGRFHSPNGELEYRIPFTAASVRYDLEYLTVYPSTLRLFLYEALERLGSNFRCLTKVARLRLLRTSRNPVREIVDAMIGNGFEFPSDFLASMVDAIQIAILAFAMMLIALESDPIASAADLAPSPGLEADPPGGQTDNFAPRC